MKLISSILLTLGLQFLYGQSKFIVFNISGQAWNTSDKSKSNFKIGQVLKRREAISLGKNSAITLICENYTTAHINQPGIHGYSEYLNNCSQQKQSLFGNYFKFIVDGFTHHEKSLEENRRENLGFSIGAIERGNSKVITDRSIDTINFYKEDFLIKWTSQLKPARFKFILSDSSKKGNLISSIPGNKYAISVDSLKNISNNRTKIYWNFLEDGNELTNRHVIQFWDKHSFDSLFNELGTESHLAPETAEWHYMKGFYLEAGHFFGEAYTHYKKALELKPNDKRFRQTVALMKNLYY